ncbi:MAG: EamA family transporter [Rhodospirillaceae bacterium]|nr:EamA family transporter [Rhodospirillaceae bacterium]|tara:strand:+ start:24096 stop:25007 length:912 start_codon:yes stop_codon:yes gene_type:complete
MRDPVRAKFGVTRFSPPVQGAIWTILASLCVVAFTSIGKYLMAEMSVPIITFFRCVFGVLFILPWIVSVGLAGLATKRPVLMIARGFNTLVGLYCVFGAVALIPLADVIAIQYSKPIFASIAAVLILREVMYGARWNAILIGFIGMLLIIRPGFTDWNVGVLYALGAMAAGAFTTISVKLMTRTEPPDRIVAYTLMVMTVGSLIPAIIYWQTPTFVQILWLILLGGLATAFQRCVARALAAADATIILPFDFMRLLIAVAFGFFIFGEALDGWTWAGGTVIFIASIYVVRAESGRNAEARSTV